jgi:predicted O-methyltransferase YrrM
MLAKKLIMYSSLHLIIKYVKYLWMSSNGNGHGVHSPFVYNFIKEVLNKQIDNHKLDAIELYRKELLQNREMVNVWDRGAGSRQSANSMRSVQQIAKVALKPKKYSVLLHKIAVYYKPSVILEMGTSLGITTSYLAASNTHAKVVTMEGAPSVANIAKNTFSRLGISNVEIIEGDFDDTLPSYLKSIDQLGIAYVDGNHRYEPTINYFNQLLEKANDHSILIFDDIHWSEEMEKAWEEIKQHPHVTLTIDLFFIGLVFVRQAQKEKEHFVIRY